MIDFRDTPSYKEDSYFRKEYVEKLLFWQNQHVIKVITGVRRSGKSVILKEVCKEISKSAQENQITFFNFEMLENEDIADYHKLHSVLKERVQKGKMNYIFLDEIQLVEKFEKVVDSLFTLPNVDIYLTGSNATMLSSEIATLLSGRYIEINVLPFSFIEFQTAYKEKFSQESFDLPTLYTKYITFGGFPYLHNLYEKNDAIRDYISGLYSTIVLKDIQQRKKIEDTILLEKIVKFALVHTGNLLSPKKICDTFVSSGRKTSSATIDNCLCALCETYLFYKLNRYDIRGKETLKTLEKYYAVDMGLRFFMLGARGGDEGHILENIVFLELLRRGYELSVGKIDDMEIDFIAQKEGVLNYIQVSLSARDEATLKRELKPLLAVKDNFPKTLITLDNAPVIYHDGIKQLYALDFLNGESL